MDALMYKLNVASEYTLLQKALKDIPGHLASDEVYLLFLLARHGDGVGEIVEIGSFMGLSTCWLALGSLFASRERVTAVDTFRGSPEHQPGAEFSCETLVKEGTTFHVFQTNLRRIGVHDHVGVIISESHVAAANWTKAIRVLFIDGDHSYEASKLDYENWSPFVAPRGYVAFHDIEAGPGVTQLYNELTQSSSSFKEVAAVNSIRVLQHVP
jgi:predicted O-methyltransferase YrrM